MKSDIKIKKRYQILAFFLIISIFLISCKKEIANESLEEIIVLNSFHERECTLTQSAILEWLQNDLTFTENLHSKEIIQKIIINSDFEQMYTEKITDTKNLTIIPLGNDYFSNNINEERNFPLQYFVLKHDNNGIISRGEIVLFYPETNGISDLPDNSFIELYSGSTFPINGTFSFINLDDMLESERTFQDDTINKTAFLYGRNDEAPVTCTAYYWVIVYHFPDGSTTENEIYLYTICPDGTSFPDASSGGGGGSYNNNNNNNNTQPQLVNATLSLLVTQREVSGGNTWGCVATWNASGWRMRNTTQNFFNQNPVYLNANAIMNGITGSGESSNPWFGTLDPVRGHTENRQNNNRTAYCSFISQMHFYNQIDPQSQTYPIYAVSNYGLWLAKDVL